MKVNMSQDITKRTLLCACEKQMLPTFHRVTVTPCFIWTRKFDVNKRGVEWSADGRNSLHQSGRRIETELSET